MNTTILNTALVAQATIPSPLGKLLLAATPRGLAGCWFDGQAHHPGTLAAPQVASDRFIAQAADELDAYWQDAVGTRFRVPLDPQGTPFQQAVWGALVAISVGSVTSYGALARQLGKPLALRAVGAAVGRNPVGILIPCHRVLGSDGSLTGYAGGLHRKTELLQREGVGPRSPRVAARREEVAA